MARETERQALVVTMAIGFTSDDGRDYFYRTGAELWSDDPAVDLLRKHSGRENIVVPKDSPRSSWPDYEAEARFGAVA